HLDERTAFVGRWQELADLEAAYRASRSGKPVTVFLHGESGVGKSALAGEFLDRLRARHPLAVVLSGRCYERETVPYKAIDPLLDSLSHLWHSVDADLEPLPALARAVLTQAFPQLGTHGSFAVSQPRDPLEPQALRRELFGAVRRLLGAIARQRPLALL